MSRGRSGCGRQHVKGSAAQFHSSLLGGCLDRRLGEFVPECRPLSSKGQFSPDVRAWPGGAITLIRIWGGPERVPDPACAPPSEVPCAKCPATCVTLSLHAPITNQHLVQTSPASPILPTRR
ncbi:hypothetical protein B0T18DRAFT_101212 [Schizothecium vesticola]|uniref:Uncharacterized protein n=1 Tax=Schizothecium vesticola TaxID=314040 RepID=A0AA40K825_9PEZI|nr:hypothetical protein B0T18DRAFT_101212 [Schizothecium vesticola]